VPNIEPDAEKLNLQRFPPAKQKICLIDGAGALVALTTMVMRSNYLIEFAPKFNGPLIE
jgi:hypothetical protein